MTGKDYYRILGLSEKASEEDIKKAYRRLALQYHPDRNPENKAAAEERFKEVSEAYGVLIDREKRRQYDRFRRVGPKDGFTQWGFRHSQEDIFRDVFRSPNASDIFRDLGSEFERFGFRFDENFFKEVFFGKKGFFFGGIFFGGPMRSGGTFKSYRSFGDLFGNRTDRMRTGFDEKVVDHGRKSGVSEGLLGKAGRKIGRYLLEKILGEKGRRTLAGYPQRETCLYHSLSIAPEEAASGTTVTISYKRGTEKEKLTVKIPAGTKPGTRLRLKGKGLENRRGQPPGDLFLKVNVKKV